MLQWLMDDYNITSHQSDKQYCHSQKRIIIEHTIFKLKKYRILADVFRNKLRKYDKIQT
jgi:hypothetical protein